MKKIKIIVVFGTRPEAIKMVPVILELKKYPKLFKTVLVSTGQHRQMLDQILGLFRIKPHYDLNIMKEDQSINEIVVNAISGIDPILKKEQPDLLLVQGDTSTAFASALASFNYKIAVGHVEAGLRTYNINNPYPEEMNRRLISSVATLHFAPTKRAADNLIKEGIAKSAISMTGNTVIDALYLTIKKPFDLKRIGINTQNKKMLLVTAHRRESFGIPLQEICTAIATIAKRYQEKLHLVLPVHRNPNVRKTVQSRLADHSNISLLDPIDYHPFVHLMDQSYLILTDSGGIQEEAPSLGKPVLVMRETTERPEAIEAGTVRLIGTKANNIIKAAERLLNDQTNYDEMAKAVNPYGDGRAAQRIVNRLAGFFGVTL